MVKRPASPIAIARVVKHFVNPTIHADLYAFWGPRQLVVVKCVAGVVQAGGLVFAPEYKNVDVSLVFGGQYQHNTWWTDEPRQITGINLLPITTAHLYLGTDPAYVKRNLAALEDEIKTYEQYGKKPRNAPPKDIWQDIFAKYMALADPEQGLKRWDRWGSVNAGDSRTHALHFISSLQAMGPPDFGVTANTPLYSVFRQADGRRTYLAFNAGQQPIQVRFSDGTQLDVAPRTLAQTQSKP
ncbi:MAG: hypothetical protein E6Q48_00135 [Limnohabitans sp.]|nr:MAG: hypothetical protein E6Q48_00135 [Limnohabitans sp.]